MNGKYEKLIDKLGRLKVLTNEPLSKYTTLKLGGCADLFLKTSTINDLVSAIISARKFDVPYFILGQGTNLLVSDSGFRGLVIKNETGKINIKAIKGVKKKKNSHPSSFIQTVYLEIESGVSVNRLVRYSMDQGLDGLQYFMGQPGTIGGAVWINAHNMKWNKYFGDLVDQAIILDIENQIRTVPKSYFRFGYDNSIIQTTKDTILSVTLKLKTGKKQDLWKIAETVRLYRHSTHPTGYYSCGCVFRNINKSDAIRLSTPNFTTSAGFLIDSLNLKGARVGGVEISNKHGNFFIHKGEAKSSDMLELIKLVKDKVRKKYGIDLKLEIFLLGDF